MSIFTENKFLFKELVKRDFKKKYKGTALGILWSILYPLIDLLILLLIFTKLLGKGTPHYPIYVFSGIILSSYFREATRESLAVLRANRNIITKIKMPNYLLILSKNVSALINFLLTLCVFTVICIIEGIEFKMIFFLLIFPIVSLTIFNIGFGLILSICYVFFKDASYLYDLLLVIISYLSATFYNITAFSLEAQRLFLVNPLFCYIKYFRLVVIYNQIPGIGLHMICIAYSLSFLIIGILLYRKNKNKIVYNL